MANPFSTPVNRPATGNAPENPFKKVKIRKTSQPFPVGSGVVECVGVEFTNSDTGRRFFLHCKVIEGSGLGKSCSVQQGMTPRSDFPISSIYGEIAATILPFYGVNLLNSEEEESALAMLGEDKVPTDEYPFTCVYYEFEARGTANGEPIVGRKARFTSSPGGVKMTGRGKDRRPMTEEEQARDPDGGRYVNVKFSPYEEQ